MSANDERASHDEFEIIRKFDEAARTRNDFMNRLVDAQVRSGLDPEGALELALSDKEITKRAFREFETQTQDVDGDVYVDERVYVDNPEHCQKAKVSKFVSIEGDFLMTHIFENFDDEEPYETVAIAINHICRVGVNYPTCTVSIDEPNGYTNPRIELPDKQTTKLVFQEIIRIVGFAKVKKDL